MKKLLLVALAAASALSLPVAAQAREGCGPGAHRTPHGRCIANGAGWRRGGVNLVIGNFYPGQGYWDGHRYWQHRERWHGGWRYR